MGQRWASFFIVFFSLLFKEEETLLTGGERVEMR